MSKTDRYAEMLLERKEMQPQTQELCDAIVIAKNSKSLYLDINKTFEGYVNKQEIGLKAFDEYQLGEKLQVFVLSGPNQEGLYKLSIKKIEDSKNWKQLEELQKQNLDVKITKIVKSGIEVEIPVTKQTGFIPFRYLDSNYGDLAGKAEEQWIGIDIPARVHEFEQSKNKIILNNKVISDELKKARAEEVLSQLAVGQEVTGKVVRITDFGVFVDIGGIDALIPASELSWRRFKKPADVVNKGDEIKAKVFRVEIDNKKIGLSVKQVQPDPWTVLPEELKVGATVKGKVITHADFGVFVEVLPGVEALLHKSNLGEKEFPAIGSEIEAKVDNIDVANKRMGLGLAEIEIEETTETQQSSNGEEKELEHV